MIAIVIISFCRQYSTLKTFFSFSYTKMTQPIDYLLAALSQTTEDSDDDFISDQRNNNVVPNQVLQNNGSSPPQVPQNTLSPTSTARRIRIIKLLSSSSLKRKHHKNLNCLFCPRFKYSRKQVESHLTESELCKALYLRKFKVTHLNGVLIKLFRCICCGDKGSLQ